MKETTVAAPSLAPAETPGQGKERYWSSLLTGDPATVPDAVRHMAGADDESRPEAERDYSLMSNINRSWVADYGEMSREQVRAAWPRLRMNLARELQVGNSEPEVYTALSMQQQEAPARQNARRVYAEAFQASLRGDTPAEDSVDDEVGRRISEAAACRGRAVREQYLPLAEDISDAWSVIKALETKMFSLPDVVAGTPGLLQAVNDLADMEPGERARVYDIARSLESSRALEEKPGHIGEAVLHSIRRGSADLGHSLVQGIGHIATALTRTAAEGLESEALGKVATGGDKRLQVLHELRRVAQGELFPIDLGEDANLAEQMAVDAAGAIPGAIMAFSGGAGFGALTLAGTGSAVAEARRRSPEGRQELQTAAGIVGGALQAGIYMGMSRFGARMLDRTIREFVKAQGAGLKGYSLATLKGLETLTAENAKLLLAGKAAQASELGMQELAARVDRVASHIDWEAFGDNMVDIEANMREAARNLPFVLIAAGRASLHHFRSPQTVLDDGQLMLEWGVEPAMRERILNEPDIHRQNDLLQNALRSSRRWAGTGAIQELIRSLKLLNTEHHDVFRDPEVVQAFLKLPADSTTLARPQLVERDVSKPEVVQQMVENMTGRKDLPLNVNRKMDYLLLWDEWFQKGNGELLKQPDELHRRSDSYFTYLTEREKAIPRLFRLDGYYHPLRPEGVRMLVSDRVNEILNCSYRFLMNTESLDSLTHSYKSVEKAREKTEAARRMFVSEICAAMIRSVQGGGRDHAFEELHTRMENFYINRRKRAAHAPRWLRQTKVAAFRNTFQMMNRADLRSRKHDEPHLQEVYRLMLASRSCAESLLDLLPHTEDFQELLTMGYSPKDAYLHLIHREFKEHLDPEICGPDLLKKSNPNLEDVRELSLLNREKFHSYMALSGHQLESSSDGKGGTLWRTKRPDGRYTPWFKETEQVMNSLVGNVQTTFLPTGKGLLYDALRQGYRRDEMGHLVFERHKLFPTPMYTFVGYDHLANAATRDLCTMWLGDSTLYAKGLEFLADKMNWKRYQGRHVDILTKEVSPDSGRYLVRKGQVLTPLDVVNLRFKSYWNRMLASGWVAPEEVARTLVEAREISDSTAEHILDIGRDKQLSAQNWSRLDGPTRRSFMKQHPARVRPGDRHNMNLKLANLMARVNLLYLLANLQESPLPDSVKQWFVTAPFSDFVPPAGFSLRHKKVLEANRMAANQIKSLIPRVEYIRKTFRDKEKLTLDARLQQSYKSDDATRYEQGWCYAVGGLGTFRGTNQQYWNLLESPLRAWNLLSEQEREHLSQELLEGCGETAPEQALARLDAVLQQYPALHAYGVDRQDAGKISRMKLGELRSQMLAHPSLFMKDDARILMPFAIAKGYQMEDGAELPAECRDDARVRPALRLLTELRRIVTAVPYANDTGIWWNHERYSGGDGKRIRGVNDSHWQAEAGLQTLMGFYHQIKDWVAAQGTNSPVEVCGVPIDGIAPEDINMNDIRHITVYRSPEMPDRMLRLMPGEVDAANPYQRAPYVVHTSDGIPLFPRRMARTEQDFLHALTPLNLFNMGLDRMYDYDTNKGWRQRQSVRYMTDLLMRRTIDAESWHAGDESKVNNMELCMQLFQDSRLPYFLEGKDPSTLTRGEALACELGRHMLLAEFGHEHDTHVADLVAFCKRLRENPGDVDLIFHVLNRVVSPYPNQYGKEELEASETDDEHE